MVNFWASESAPGSAPACDVQMWIRKGGGRLVPLRQVLRPQLKLGQCVFWTQEKKLEKGCQPLGLNR